MELVRFKKQLPTSAANLYRRWLLLTSLLVLVLWGAVYYSTAASFDWSNTDASTLRHDGVGQHDHPSILIKNATPYSQDVRDSQIVWMLSFGGSGTSYTIMNIEQLTDTTTATNYARDISPSVPVHPNSTSGPFLHQPSRFAPPLILTKSHCGGYCMDCGISEYNLTARQFEQACRTGTKFGNGGSQVVYETKSPSSSSPNLISKAIHLIRNPFDNLVGRMHLASKHQLDRGESGFDHSKEGFGEWCRYLDSKYAGQDQESNFFDMDLPCRAEWYRYIQWHNYAAAVTSEYFSTQESDNVYYLYYDNYTSHYSETVGQVLDFLDLKSHVVRQPYPFMPGKTYVDYFEVKDRQRAARFAKSMASPKAWILLAHFFEPYLDDTTDDSSEPATVVVTIKDYRDGEDDVSSDVKTELEPVLTEIDDDDIDEIAEEMADNDGLDNFQYNNRSEVVWLMSFPNSGTSYTITNTERMSQRSTASNYAEGFKVVIPVRPELAKDGPFLHDPSLQIAVNTLTKSHCGSYCGECPPSAYVSTLDSFQKACLSGHKNDQGQTIDTTYDASVPNKAVHIIRSPFDNIVARMHLAIKKRKQSMEWDEEKLATFSNSQEGLDTWCKFHDGLYAKEEDETALISAGLKEAWRGLPCRAEWYRWVQWHNLALQLLSRLQQRPSGFPVHLLYYEDYSANYNTTLSNLFEFLELEVEREPIDFIPGKTYLDLFPLESQRQAARFIKIMATPECWELVKHYFEGMLE